MKLVKTNSEQLPSQYIANEISKRLAIDKTVLWLVPGGSAKMVAVSASKLITGVGSSLFISLTDERPGAAGHKESNWQQLKNFEFKLLGREYYEILQNTSTEKEIEAYNAWLKRMINSVDFKIGLFGIGADGHTAGILPNTREAPPGALAAYYNDRQRQRISVTPTLIANLDLAVVYAVGSSKQTVIEELSGFLPTTTAPMHSLKQARQLVVYNDYKGDLAN